MFGWVVLFVVVGWCLLLRLFLCCLVFLIIVVLNVAVLRYWLACFGAVEICLPGRLLAKVCVVVLLIYLGLFDVVFVGFGWAYCL